MSTKVMQDCWELQLPVGKKLLLISLADQANDDGICEPVPESTASRSCMHRATLFRSLNWLEKRGYVQRHGTDRRRKTYRVTPHLGQCAGRADSSVVARRRVRLPAATTVVAASGDYGSRAGATTVVATGHSSSPPITPSPSVKEKERDARAQETDEKTQAEAAAGPVPTDFHPPAWVADRLASAGLPREYQPHHVQHFIAYHQAKRSRRDLEGWASEFVSWMIREHKHFSQAKSAQAPAATPAQQRAGEVGAAVNFLAGDLRSAYRLKLQELHWKDSDATAVIAELGGWLVLRDLGRSDFDGQVLEFARRYRARRLPVGAA